MDEATQPRTAHELVHAHYQDVYRFAYRLSGRACDAEDLTQQTFLIACRKLSQLREEDRVRAWLFTIVRNEYLKSRRREDRELPYEPVGDGLERDHWSPEEFDEERLQAALMELPESYRSVVLLYYFEDLSYREIADLTQVPLGTVMSRLSRSKQFLRDRLLAGTPVSTTS